MLQKLLSIISSYIYIFYLYHDRERGNLFDLRVYECRKRKMSTRKTRWGGGGREGSRIHRQAFSVSVTLVKHQTGRATYLLRNKTKLVQSCVVAIAGRCWPFNPTFLSNLFIVGSSASPVFTPFELFVVLTSFLYRVSFSGFFFFCLFFEAHLLLW